MEFMSCQVKQGDCDAMEMEGTPCARRVTSYHPSLRIGRHLRFKRSSVPLSKFIPPMVRFACPEPSASASTLDGPSQSRPSPHPRLKKSIKKSHKPRELDRIKVKFTGPLPRRTIYVGNVSAN